MEWTGSTKAVFCLLVFLQLSCHQWMVNAGPLMICVDQHLTITADSNLHLFIDNVEVDLQYPTFPQIADTTILPASAKVVAVSGQNEVINGGFLGSSGTFVTDASWKCTDQYHDGWQGVGFDDSTWKQAYEVRLHGDSPWYNITGIRPDARWIWIKPEGCVPAGIITVYCRKSLVGTCIAPPVQCSTRPPTTTTPTTTTPIPTRPPTTTTTTTTPIPTRPPTTTTTTTTPIPTRPPTTTPTTTTPVPTRPPTTTTTTTTPIPTRPPTTTTTTTTPVPTRPPTTTTTAEPTTTTTTQSPTRPPPTTTTAEPTTTTTTQSPTRPPPTTTTAEPTTTTTTQSPTRPPPTTTTTEPPTTTTATEPPTTTAATCETQPPPPPGTTFCSGTGPTCITSCTDKPNGDYQSCKGCSMYATCSNGILDDGRPCEACLVWDDVSKTCQYESSTCTECHGKLCSGSGAACIASCKKRADGDYQSCKGWDVYATCTNGRLYDKRPCAVRRL